MSDGVIFIIYFAILALTFVCFRIINYKKEKLRKQNSCNHEWEIIEKNELYNPAVWSQYPTNIVYTMQCKKCGEIKFEETESN